jgi:hypothetical protein
MSDIVEKDLPAGGAITAERWRPNLMKRARLLPVHLCGFALAQRRIAS